MIYKLIFPITCDVLHLSSKEEKELRSAIVSLKKENATVQNTVVQLESYQTNDFDSRQKPNAYDTKKLDLEMAVLMQVRATYNRTVNITVHIQCFNIFIKRVGPDGDAGN